MEDTDRRGRGQGETGHLGSRERRRAVLEAGTGWLGRRFGGCPAYRHRGHLGFAAEEVCQRIAFLCPKCRRRHVVLNSHTRVRVGRLSFAR